MPAFTSSAKSGPLEKEKAAGMGAVRFIAAGMRSEAILCIIMV
jgi:hypothetical protein